MRWEVEGRKAWLLDHGYIELIETWGSEERIIESARMSTGKGFNSWGPKHRELCLLTQQPDSTCTCDHKAPGDEKLLRFLWENSHQTPFEMAGATFEVQAPIFVFREWHRHRVPFSYNEMSARYAPLPDVNYIPSVERLMQAGTSNKQTQALAPIDREQAETFRMMLFASYKASEHEYQSALVGGVAKELARLVLPVGRYSKMRASSNLRGWLNFLKLRQAPNAQYEIRVFADALHDILAAKFPRTLALFDEGHK